MNTYKIAEKGLGLEKFMRDFREDGFAEVYKETQEAASLFFLFGAIKKFFKGLKCIINTCFLQR